MAAKFPYKGLPAYGLLSIYLMAGCANQATVVELEDYTLKLEKHQIELQRRLEMLEGRSAGPSAHDKNQQLMSAGLIAQLSDIEADVREVRGRIDETGHQLSTLHNKMDTETFRSEELLRRINHLEKRMTLIEGKTPDRSKTPEKRSDRLKGRSDGNRNTALSPADAYNLAYNDYIKGNYIVAISAFDAFIKHYPDSVLVPQALYWMGESYYSEQSYWSAVKTFKYMLQTYPQNEKTSNALLKIGFSYLALDKPSDGKRFLNKVVRQFPNSDEAPLAEERLAGLE
ncbi:MAG: tol-pal system protein YbgF [Nitrospiria bacterium]